MHLQIPTERAWQNAPRYALTGVWLAAPPSLSGCCCKRSGLGGLGDATPLTPDQALQQAMQGESSPDFGSSSWLAAAVRDVASRRMPVADFSPNCANMAAPKMNLFSTASGLALSTAAVGTSIATVTGAIAAGTGAMLGAATMGAGLVVSVIGMIVAHHTAAVKQEQQLGCAAMSAANNALDVLDQALAAGQTTPEAASAGLDNLLSQYQSYVAPSVGHNPCNANCEGVVLLKGIILYTKSIYAGMAAQSAPPDPAVTALQTQAQQLQQQAAQAQANGDVATANALNAQAAALTQQATTLAASGGSSLPPWIWLAAAGLGAFLFLR